MTAENLPNFLMEHYRIEVRSVQFRARGWGGDSYIAEAKDTGRYFLKLQPLSGPEWASAPSEPRFYLPLLHQLHERRIINVPRLVMTRDGGCAAAVDGYELVVYEWIDGEVVGFGRMPEPVLAELAGMIGKLHAATSKLRFEHEFSESCELGVEADLLASLEGLSGSDIPRSPGGALLRTKHAEVVKPILAGVERFRELQQYARGLDKTRVICHTDLHGGNLMLDLDGELVLLDWENAMLAPPEHDLFFVAGKPEFRDVWLPRYQATAGPVEVDPGLLGFYWYRRALEDVAGLLTRILAGDGDEERDRSDLEYLLENIAWLDRIDSDVAEFRASL